MRASSLDLVHRRVALQWVPLFSCPAGFPAAPGCPRRFRCACSLCQLWCLLLHDSATCVGVFTARCQLPNQAIRSLLQAPSHVAVQARAWSPLVCAAAQGLRPLEQGVPSCPGLAYLVSMVCHPVFCLHVCGVCAASALPFPCS